jgi:uncharacterized repeat protein (TIGR01451 family)
VVGPHATGGTRGLLPLPRQALTLLALIGVALLTIVPVLGSPGYAAPGDPFDPAVPTVFISQGVPTQLSRALASTGGAISFVPEGAPAPVTYNAIGYRTADNFIYGVVQTGNATFPRGSIVRIGQGGVLTRVGTQTVGFTANWGTMVGDNFFYFGESTVANAVARYNFTTGQIETVNLPTILNTPDLTYQPGGFLWGINQSGQIIRVTVDTAANTMTTSAFPLPAGVPAGAYGAVWTYPNGDIGVSNNTTGTIYQIRVTNPGGTPTFTVVASVPGSPNANNDGTASPGLPTDLAVVKSGPGSVTPGGALSYQVSVTNNGPGVSSGWVATDTPPVALANVRSATPGCTVAGGVVTCTGGRLDVGTTALVTITGDIPADFTGCLTNSASVLGNETDPNAVNNTAAFTTCSPHLALAKTADVSAITNPPHAGQIITFHFTATNTGLVPLTAVAITDQLPGLSPLAYTWPGPAGVLQPGQSVTATATYPIRQADIDAGGLTNSALATGTPPAGPPITSPPAGTEIPIPPILGLTLAKTADTGSITAPAHPGQVISYRFAATNSGNVTLTGVSITDALPGLSALAYSWPGTPGVLAPGQSVTATARYAITRADIDAGIVSNRATATGTSTFGPSITTAPVRTQVRLTAAGLPTTGRPVTGMIAAGLALLVAGTALLLAARQGPVRP